MRDCQQKTMRVLARSHQKAASGQRACTVSFVRGLRWYILALIFLATCINYVDRSSVGLLFTQFGPHLGISREQYGWVGAVLLLAYTISQSISGRFFDRFGSRAGFAVSISIWCLAAMMHSAIVGAGSFAVASFFLGFGEAGNWPGAAKVVAEWFPQSERAIGMAIFNGGASMGAVLAPILVAGWLDPLVGWRRTFLIVGSFGFIWLMGWLWFYRPVDKHSLISAAEKNYIRTGQLLFEKNDPPPAPSRLLSLRQTWAIILARFLVDPIWWLYLLWLPEYLKDVHHFNLKEIGLFQWAPYVCAALGSVFGGWLSGWLIKRGRSVNAARKIAIGAAACLMPLGILAAQTSNPIGALALIAMVLFGFQMWISNVQTLPSDCFPTSAVGFVAGIGGSAAGISSLLFNLGTGWLVAHFGYAVVLTLAGILGPVGAIVLFLLIGPIHNIEAKKLLPQSLNITKGSIAHG
jgi:MFS transporter, ACS family, aldohexuronate transporter